MSQVKGPADIKYLQTAADLMQQTKQRSYVLTRAQPGDRVLDVGCGPGTDTLALASVVGSQGLVVGLDHDPAMIAEAERRVSQAGVSAWVQHRVGDAVALPFDADYFDACRSERLFQHLAQPELALREMVRVTRPGGWIVVMDTDWATSSADTRETDIERRLARFYAEHYLNNGYAGRQLYRLFKQLNLQEVELETYVGHTTSYAMARYLALWDKVAPAAVAAGAITADEARRFFGSLEQADVAGEFFATLGGVIAAGRR